MLANSREGVQSQCHFPACGADVGGNSVGALQCTFGSPKVPAVHLHHRGVERLLPLLSGGLGPCGGEERAKQEYRHGYAPFTDHVTAWRFSQPWATAGTWLSFSFSSNLMERLDRKSTR